MSTSSDENFLARWSRLKRRPVGADEDVAPADQPLSQQHGETRPEAEFSDDTGHRSIEDGEPGGEASQSEPKLRDFSEFEFEKLDFNSDYSQFMKDDVPVEARNKALRQLWSSDPVFARMDGLDDYCEDYTDAAMVPVGAVRTAYRVGKGFLSDAEVAEWDKLGTREDTEGTREDTDIAVVDDGANEGIGDAGISDAGALDRDDTIGDDHASDASDASDPGALIDTASCPGAACAASVKQEEQAALDAYEAELKKGERSESLPGGHASASRGQKADKDNSTS